MNVLPNGDHAAMMHATCGNTRQGDGTHVDMSFPVTSLTIQDRVAVNENHGSIHPNHHVHGMDSQPTTPMMTSMSLAEWDAMLVGKEVELCRLSVDRSNMLRTLLADKERECQRAWDMVRQLQVDFEYNLSLIDARDIEIAKYVPWDALTTAQAH